VFHVSVLGGLGALFGGTKPPKAPPEATGLHPTLSRLHR